MITLDSLGRTNGILKGAHGCEEEEDGSQNGEMYIFDSQCQVSLLNIPGLQDRRKL